MRAAKRGPRRGGRGNTGGEGGIRTLEGLAPLTVFETARFSRSRTSPLLFLHDLAGLAQASPERLLPQLLPNVRGSSDPFRFCPYVLVGEPRVALGRRDRRVSENLLQRGQVPSSFDPATRERMTELMRVKTLHSRIPSHLPRKPGRVPYRNQAPHTESKLRVHFRKRHAPQLPGLGLTHDQHALLYVDALGTNQLAPSQPGFEPKSNDEPVRLRDAEYGVNLFVCEPVWRAFLNSRQQPLWGSNFFASSSGVWPARTNSISRRRSSGGYGEGGADFFGIVVTSDPNGQVSTQPGQLHM